MIKAILFDFSQTLVHSAAGFRAAEKEAQTKIFDHLALTSWDDFISNYRKIRNDFQQRSNLSRIAIWQEVYWYYCREADSERLEKWERDYWEIVEARTTIFPEAEPVLEKLATRYRLAMISNTQGQTASEQHQLSNYPQLTRFFDVVIIAGQSDVPPKPSSVPFLKCLEMLEVIPSEAVYVGDDWRNDVCGAMEAGLQPVWIKHHSVARTWPKADRTVPEITSLEQLFGIEAIGFGEQCS